MLPDVEVPAPSTVAPELAAAGTDAQNTPVDLAALSSQQYDRWRQTGETPEATPKPAESAPAKESAAPAGGTAPDSEPGKKSEEPEKHKGAEARKEQLAVEIQEILRARRERAKGARRSRLPPPPLSQRTNRSSSTFWIRPKPTKRLCSSSSGHTRNGPSTSMKRQDKRLRKKGPPPNRAKRSPIASKRMRPRSRISRQCPARLAILRGRRP